MTHYIEPNDGELAPPGRMRLVARHLRAKLLEWMHGHPRTVRRWRNAALALVVVALVATVEHYREVHVLENAIAAQTAVMRPVLDSPLGNILNLAAVHTESLEQQLGALSITTDQTLMKLRATRHPLAPSTKDAALAYSGQISTIAAKLHAIAVSTNGIARAIDSYETSIAALKASGYGTRARAQTEADHAAAEVRRATELAYRDCQLLQSLVDQLEYRQSRAREYLRTDALLSAGELSRLHNLAAELAAHSHTIMKAYNQTARS